MSIAVGQHATASGNSPTTGAVTTQVSGSTFVIFVLTDTSHTIGTPTDSKSNSYTAIGSEQAYGSVAPEKCRVFYKENGVGGSGHTANSGAGTFTSIFFLEITGAAASSFDSGSVAQANDAVSPYTVTSNTLAQAAELVVATIGFDSIIGGTVFSESTGFTIQDQEQDGTLGSTGAIATKIVSSTTALTPSFTIAVGNGSETALTIIGFKEAATDSGVIHVILAMG